MTLLDLSRWQFALTAAFHMTFPAVTVGLSVFCTVLYGVYWRSGNPLYLQLFRFWKRIFAVGFGLGVVAGTVLTFEFGLNWGGYAHAVGPVLGVTIGMEVITAFFLEAGFIGILLYGDGRVSRPTMFSASFMVTIGTLLSTTWILSANSWMQSPAGFEVVDGQFQPTSWTSVLFNPSFTLRYPHMLLAVLISAAWMVAGVSAYYLLHGRATAFARRGLSIALGTAALLVPVQLYVGDQLAGFDAIHQPPKFAAFEGHWDSTSNSYNLLVVPDQAHQRNDAALAVPYLGSIIGKDLSGQGATPGQDMIAPDRRPDEWATFYGFRVMFYSALTMFGAAFAGVVLRLRRRLFTSRRFHRLLVLMTPIGPTAVIAGWVLAETGRQPWVVYGQLATSASVSHLAPASVWASLIGFVGLYAALLVVYVSYVARSVRRGPGEPDATPAPASGVSAATRGVSR